MLCPASLQGRRWCGERGERRGIDVGAEGRSARLGRLDLADPLVRGALDELQAMLPADAPQIAAALLEIGELHLAREQYADADDPLTRAAAIFAKHAEPDHPPLARARFALARARTGAATTTAPANRALAESAAAGFQAPAAASEAAALTRWLAEHPPA